MYANANASSDDNTIKVQLVVEMVSQFVVKSAGIARTTYNVAPIVSEYPVTTSGEWRRGMSQLVKGMLDTSARNPGTRAITIAAVRFVTPDVAIVDGEYKTGADARLIWTTLTVKRDGRGWKIAAIRNIAPTSPTR